MAKTVWTNNVKEGFVEQTGTSSSTSSPPKNDKAETTEVADFGNDVFIGKDPDELILTGKQVPEKTEEPKDKSTQPNTSQSEELNDAAQNMDVNKVKRIYDDAISSAIKKIFEIDKIIATKIVSAFYDNIETTEARNDIEILAFQISLWIILLFASYLFAVNWWYLWCYSEFKFDFKSLIFIVLHWPMSGPLNAIQFFNYPLIGFRMDKKLKPEYQTWFNQLFEWRPMLFSLFHLFIFSVLLLLPFGSTLESMMTGKGIFFIIMSTLSVFYFITMFFKEEWYAKFMKSGTVVGYLILIAFLIGAIILMFLFIYMACPVFTIYILVLSCFSLLLFENVNAYNRWEQIFDDLIKPVKSDSKKPTKSSFIDKLFKNFHTIYFFIMVFVIIICNLYASSNLKSEPLTALNISMNVCLVVAICLYIVLFLVYKDETGNASGPIPSSTESNLKPSDENIYPDTPPSGFPSVGTQFTTPLENATADASLDPTKFTNPLQNTINEHNPISMLGKKNIIEEGIKRVDGSLLKNIGKNMGLVKDNIPQWGT